jgi:hypothetical protein
MRTKGMSVAVVALLAVAAVPLLMAQSVGTQHTFTLSWQLNTGLSTLYAVRSLASFDGVAAQSSVCGQAVDGSNIWCGMVRHYAADPAQALYDFNFDGLLLSGCQQVGATSVTYAYATINRRTQTAVSDYSCADADANEWSVVLVVSTYQYRSAQGRYYYWYNFAQGQQPPVMGTLTEVATDE